MLKFECRKIVCLAILHSLGFLIASSSIGEAASNPSQQAKSSAECKWVPGFHQAGPSGTVSATVVYDDGTGPALYAAGRLNAADDTVAHHIAKWDGSSWSPLGEGTNNAVRALAVYDDGTGPKLIAGGYFSSAGRTPASRVAQWDGTSWSALGMGADGPVDALAVYDDGGGPKLTVGGSFTSAGGLPANRVAQWDGTSWSPLGSGVNQSVKALTVFDDGSGIELIVGGTFSQAGGASANKIARWDGKTWSPLGSGVDGSVDALTVLEEGSGPKLIVGGSFDQAGGLAAEHIARWDGTAWSALGGGSVDRIYALTVYDDGAGPKLIAGGSFDDAGEWAAIQWDGAAWSPLANGLDPAHFHRVETLAVFDSGSGQHLFAGGTFDTPGQAQHLALWSGTGWDLVSAGSGNGLDGEVRELAVHDDGTGSALYAITSLPLANGSTTQHVVTWDGTSWNSLDPSFTGHLHALGSWDDGSGPALYVGATDPIQANFSYVAKWDGSAWVAETASFEGTILAMGSWDDSTGPALFVGGEFPGIAGDPSTAYLAKWDGIAWSALAGGVDGSVFELKVLDDGAGPALYVAGDFSTVDGTPAWGGIARWDGSAWSVPEQGFDGSATVRSLAIYTDELGPVLHAGGSIEFGREPESLGGFDCCLARWDGIHGWTFLDTDISNAFHSQTVYDPGGAPRLFTGGYFQFLNGLPAKSVAAWDGSAWDDLGGGVSSEGFNENVWAMATFDDGTGPALYVGGLFSTAGDTASSNIAKYRCPPMPNLGIEENIPAIAGQSVDIPIALTTFGAGLIGTSFSVDFDQTCLSLDPTDEDTDGIPDALVYHGPAGYQLEVTVDVADTDGELDISLFDAFPSSLLGDGSLFTLSLDSTCTPPLGADQSAAVRFSVDPEPSFTNDQVQNLAGSWTDGSVTVFNGVRGDCNGDGTLANVDLVADTLEIFDGDGAFWADVPAGTFTGDPIGCDANADTSVDAGDISCIHLLIFGSTCAGSPLSRRLPKTESTLRLELGPWELPVEGDHVTAELVLSSPDHDINSLAVSLDLDTDRYTIDTTDADDDGLPDAITVIGAAPSNVDASWNPTDLDGELDLLLTRPGTQSTDAFPDTLTVRIEARLFDPSAAGPYVQQPFRYSTEPLPSAGDVTGRSQPLTAVLPIVGLFSDGFESGDTSAWSVQ